MTDEERGEGVAMRLEGWRPMSDFGWESAESIFVLWREGVITGPGPLYRNVFSYEGKYMRYWRPA